MKVGMNNMLLGGYISLEVPTLLFNTIDFFSLSLKIKNEFGNRKLFTRASMAKVYHDY